MSEYNPELIIKLDDVKADKGEGGFVGEAKTKRSDHQKAKKKLYAVSYNHVDVQFPYSKPYETETRFGKRWIFTVYIVDANPAEHELSIVDDEGKYRTSWFAPTSRVTYCKACKKQHWGKHLDECDCGSENVDKRWMCKSDKEFRKVLTASGYDQDRWEDFTYRMSVVENDKGYKEYHLDCIKAPDDAEPSEGTNLLTGGSSNSPWDGNEELKAQVESTLVPAIVKLAKDGGTLDYEDWLKTFVEHFAVDEQLAEELYDARSELENWPDGI